MVKSLVIVFFAMILQNSANAQQKAVVARFSYDTTNVCEGIIVFSDSSSGNPTHWHWDFGDNASTTIQHPTHTYSRLDSFKVTLTVWNASDSDTIAKTIVLRKQPIDIDFVADTQMFCSPPATVTFTNLTKNAVDFLWIFGDGDTSSQKNPTHTYRKDSTINVTLMAHSLFCGIDQKTIPRFVVFDTSLMPSVTMPDTGWEIRRCPHGILLDDGGANGDYHANIHSQITLAPQCADFVRLVVKQASMEYGHDSIIVYDGNTTSAPVLASFSNRSELSSDTLFSSDTAVTIVFVSDNNTQQAGFEIEWLRQQFHPLADFSYTVSQSLTTEVHFHNHSLHIDSCRWQFPGDSLSNEPNPIYRFDSLGTYTVTLVAYHLCETDTLSQTILLNGLNLPHHLNTLWRVYPNPGNGRFIIEGKDSITALKLYNMNGRLIFSKSMIFDKTIHLRGLSSGLYNLVIFGKEKTQTTKILIQ